MSRLTKWENGELYCRQDERFTSYRRIGKGNVRYATISELARYEDLEEQLMESAEIDIDNMIGEFMHYYKLKKENRLIEPPCEVGDELFIIHRTFKDVIVKGVCIGYTWWRTDGFCIMFHSDTPGYEKVDIAFSKFGKTVFLTKAEAEQKLQELKEGELNA